MPDPATAAALLRRHLEDPASSFSIGSFGAIAEFHRETTEPLTVMAPERLTIATARGAMRITLRDPLLPLAYETLSGRGDGWQQGMVFCLPDETGASHRRSTVTELGPDHESVRDEDRAAVLFDLGLAAHNVDFCVRTAEPALIDALRRAAGRSLFEPGSPLMAALLAANPHRVALSALGRIEVYQPIATEVTPHGPHTHLLPQFLRKGRTHSANVPVPAGWLPCLSLYPPSPLVDGRGRPKPFDAAEHAAFQDLVEAWGAPAYRAAKQRILAAVADDDDPAGFAVPESRLGRLALRIALKQLRRSRPGDPAVAAWSARFTRPGLTPTP